MATSRDAQRLAGMAAELTRDTNQERTVATILDQAVEIVAGTDHASLAVRRPRSGFVTLAATSSLAQHLDEWQYALGEGPCVQVVGMGAWVRSDKIATETRWPVWSSRAAAAGVGSVFCIRLSAHGDGIGAINLYADAPAAFADGDVLDLAVLYATHAAQALSAALTVSGLTTAMTSRHTIGVALGIVMERYALDEEQAFALLRRLSSVHNVRLRDLAAELVRTGRLSGLTDDPRPRA